MGLKPEKTKRKGAPRERSVLDDDPPPRPAKKAKRPPERETAPPEPTEKAPERATELSTKAFAAAGVAAAMVLAVVVSVLSARHYERWDVTRGGLFTLSPASLETLHALPGAVKLIVLMGEGDPMRAPVDETLMAYLAETKNLEVVYADPDKRAADFLAVQQKYDLGVVDAAMIVVHEAADGERHFFISPRDLVQFDQADDMRASPRIEEAITSAIRSVFVETRTVACVTQGHGEPQLEVGGDTGLAYLKDRLTKNNFEVVPVFGDPASGLEDPLHDCSFLIVAGPTQRLPKEEAKEIERFIEHGGSALLVVGPIPSEVDGGYVDAGLGGALALAGVKLADNFILELDPAARMPTGFGDMFFTQIQTHPVTQPLLREEIHVGVNVTGSLVDLKGDASPLPLLKTSAKAVGVADFFTWAKSPDTYVRKPADVSGPLVVAAASERPKLDASDERGARIVTIASFASLFGVNWREPQLRGMATFVESAISWASSHRAFLDIPSKPTMTMGLRLSEDSVKSIRTYVFTLPVLASFAGIAAFLMRRRRAPGETSS